MKLKCNCTVFRIRANNNTFDFDWEPCERHAPETGDKYELIYLLLDEYAEAVTEDLERVVMERKRDVTIERYEAFYPSYLLPEWDGKTRQQKTEEWWDGLRESAKERKRFFENLKVGIDYAKQTGNIFNDEKAED